MRLRRIFQNPQVSSRRDLANCVHIRRAAIKMNGNDGTAARRDRPLDQLRVNIRGGRINIHKYGTCAAIRNRFGRGQKRIRRGDHVVTRLDTQRQQAHMERCRSAAQGDAVARPEKSANSRSNASTSSPCTNDECRQTRSSAGKISSRNSAYSALDQGGGLLSRVPFETMKTVVYLESGHKPGLFTLSLERVRRGDARLTVLNQETRSEAPPCVRRRSCQADNAAGAFARGEVAIFRRLQLLHLDNQWFKRRRRARQRHACLLGHHAPRAGSQFRLTLLRRGRHDPGEPSDGIVVINAAKNRLRQIQAFNLAAFVLQDLVGGQEFPIPCVCLLPFL